jgi:hypothetical protein
MENYTTRLLPVSTEMDMDVHIRRCRMGDQQRGAWRLTSYPIAGTTPNKMTLKRKIVMCKQGGNTIQYR